MCGIAGVIDLYGQQMADSDALARMAAAMHHRGPDEGGCFEAPGVSLTSRRLSIVGLADGQQPVWNEDRSVVAVFNGEMFDFPECREKLEALGHRFTTHTDSELLVHLWEEYGEDMLAHTRGQFAFALHDTRRRVVILARDRVGICPLHWTRQGDRLLFASEIKSLLASGDVPAAADPRGLDHMFTFFAMPSRRTAFAGISSVLPGWYLRIALRGGRQPAEVEERCYWDFDFPDRGAEYDPPDADTAADEFGETFARAVDLRLRADVPVVGYLSGGIDSAAVLSAVSQVRGRSVPSFTIRIPTKRFDETENAMLAAQTIGTQPTVVECAGPTLAAAYPRVVQAADCPVVDTACAALFLLSAEVQRQGYKVALTGEGSDEALAGYPWFKIHKLMCAADCGAFRPSRAISRLLRRATIPSSPLGKVDRLLGGMHAQTDLYHLVSQSRRRFFSPAMFEALDGHLAYEDLELNRERMRTWHPLNQSLYLGYKTILPGLLLNHKGDRVAMAHSVETRYPFLDEDVIAYCARLHPKWKLRGIRRDKYVLRRYAARSLPREIALRPKAMFRAPFADTFFATAPDYVGQLLSRESLERTPYFDAAAVRARYAAYREGSASSRRVFVEMGLITVLATQLWHHLYLGGGLCELPTWTPPAAFVPLAASGSAL